MQPHRAEDVQKHRYSKRREKEESEEVSPHIHRFVVQREKTADAHLHCVASTVAVENVFVVSHPLRNLRDVIQR